MGYSSSLAATHGRRIAWVLGTGVLLFVLGTKLGLIVTYGTDQPFADQWAAEGVGFLQAPLHADLNWASFFWPHGEHRPAITRLVTRGLIVANEGQWDCFVEVVFNLSFYAMLVIAVWRLACRVTWGRGRIGSAVLISICFALPCAYENLLWGFQSQFIFMLVCGAAHLLGTLRSDRLGAGWWLGQLAGWCGLFTIAAGVMSAAMLVAVSSLELIRGSRGRTAKFTLLANTLLVAVGLWALPAGLDRADGLWTAITHALVHTGYLLAWPQQGLGWSILLQAPVIAAAVAWIFGSEYESEARLLAAVGGWICLVAFAVGYGRTLTPETIGNRYYDVLIVGLIVNGLVLIRAFSSPLGRALPAWKLLAVAWLLAASTGLWGLNRPMYSTAMLRQHRAYAEEQRDLIRDFLVTDDPAALTAFEARTHRLPHLRLTIDLLRDSTVQPHLPPSLVPDGRTGRLSRYAPGIAATWPGWVALGLVALIAGSYRSRALRPAPGA